MKINSNIQSPCGLCALLFLTLFATLSQTNISAEPSRSPLPILIVIAPLDFNYQEYADVTHQLRKNGIKPITASVSTQPAIPQDRDRSKTITPDISLEEVQASEHSSIVFVGGYGSAMYQYDFRPLTQNSLQYQSDIKTLNIVNTLINDFLRQQKPVSAISHGVTVLAWARVDGESPINGRVVAAWAGGGPGFTSHERIFPDSTVPTRWHIEINGGIMPLSAAIGDPLSSHDDVWVDGKIITAENYQAAATLARVLAGQIKSNQRLR